MLWQPRRSHGGRWVISSQKSLGWEVPRPPAPDSGRLAIAPPLLLPLPVPSQALPAKPQTAQCGGEGVGLVSCSPLWGRAVVDRSAQCSSLTSPVPLTGCTAILAEAAPALTGEAAQDLLRWALGSPVCGLHWPQGFRRVSAWREPCPGFPQKGGIASPTCFPRVLWGGQELGLTGSARWEQRHCELSRARAGLPGVLSAPTGAGKQPVLRSSWGFPGAGQPGRSLQAGAGTALPLPWL